MRTNGHSKKTHVDLNYQRQCYECCFELHGIDIPHKKVHPTKNYCYIGGSLGKLDDFNVYLSIYLFIYFNFTSNLNNVITTF